MVRKATHTHTPNRMLQAILASALAISFASAAQSQQIHQLSYTAGVDGPEIGSRSIGNALGREKENRAADLLPCNLCTSTITKSNGVN
jgi:hypothetical protein